MSKLPNHYKLHSEKNDHFVIHDSRDNKKFTIAKKGLHPAHQADILRLKRFDEGGKVPVPSSQSDNTPPPENSAEHEKAMANNGGSGASSFSDAMYRLAHPLNLGGKVQKLSGGGDAEDDEDASTDQEVNGNEAYANKVAGNDIQPVLDVQGLSDINGPRAPSVEVAQSDLPPEIPSGQADQATGQPPQNQSVMAQAQAGYPTTGELNSAINQGIAGVQNEASAQQKQNMAMAAQQQKDLQKQQAYFEAQQSVLKNYQDQYDNMVKDIGSGKIDPNHYWDSKSTGQKVGAAIAMMLGGLGAGLTGGPNVALEMMEKHLQNDIEAQKATLGNKLSLLSRNLAMQGNIHSATNMTLLQMKAMAEGRLNQIAMQTGNPIIQARAQILASQIRQSTIPARIQLANNEISMRIRGDVLNRLTGQGQPGVEPVDMNDLARAQLVSPEVAEKEAGAIQKRQQAEAYATDQITKLDKEKNIFSSNFPFVNPINPNSWDRAKQYEAGLTQAVLSAGTAKRFTPEAIHALVQPYVSGYLTNKYTKEEALRGVIGLIRSHADPTPNAVHYRIPGANSPLNVNVKSYKMGPVK